jgi:hypothetical protein
MRACADAWREAQGVDVVWDFRSLEAFGDQPLEQVAPDYDLLVIDHPFCGTAAATGCLAALDELVDPETLSMLADDAVGPSHMSYSFGGRQWALATDAACQVAAFRPDLLGAPLPASWDGILDLARSRPRRVAVPLAPAHAISSFLSLCANSGEAPAKGDSLVDDETGVRAVSLLSGSPISRPRGAGLSERCSVARASRSPRPLAVRRTRPSSRPGRPVRRLRGRSSRGSEASREAVRPGATRISTRVPDASSAARSPRSRRPGSAPATPGGRRSSARRDIF